METFSTVICTRPLSSVTPTSAPNGTPTRPFSSPVMLALPALTLAFRSRTGAEPPAFVRSNAVRSASVIRSRKAELSTSCSMRDSTTVAWATSSSVGAAAGARSEVKPGISTPATAAT